MRPPRNNYFSLFYYDCVGKNRGTVVYSFMKKMGADQGASP